MNPSAVHAERIATRKVPKAIQAAVDTATKVEERRDEANKRC